MTSVTILDTWSLFDVLIIIPCGQKYLIMVDGVDGASLVVDRAFVDAWSEECRQWAVKPPKALPTCWSALKDHGLIDVVDKAVVSLPHGTVFPMTSSHWSDLAHAVKTLPVAQDHTPLDDAMLLGMANGLPKHQVETAWRWCESNGVSPVETLDDGRFQWQSVLDTMRHQPTLTVKKTTTPAPAPKSVR